MQSNFKRDVFFRTFRDKKNLIIFRNFRTSGRPAIYLMIALCSSPYLYAATQRVYTMVNPSLWTAFAYFLQTMITLMIIAKQSRIVLIHCATHDPYTVWAHIGLLDISSHLEYTQSFISHGLSTKDKNIFTKTCIDR